jgi:uncharacterized Tic20 family protein
METLTPLNEQQQSNETSHAVIIHISALSSYIGVPFGSILGPLITWLIWRDQSDFTDVNGKEALNFNLSLFLYQFIALIIGVILFITPILSMGVTDNPNPLAMLLSIPGLWIFIGGFSLLTIFRVVMIIVAAVKAGNGEIFHYPLSIKFIK